MSVPDGCQISKAFAPAVRLQTEKARARPERLTAPVSRLAHRGRAPIRRQVETGWGVRGGTCLQENKTGNQLAPIAREGRCLFDYQPGEKFNPQTPETSFLESGIA